MEESERADPDTEGSSTWENRPMPRWLRVVLMLVAAVLVPLLVLDRVHIGGQVLTAPGGTLDIEPFVEVRGVDIYPTGEQIRLVTVQSNLDPSLLELIGGWLDGSIRVQDREDVLGSRTVEENRTLGMHQMAQSLEIASRVALERLGYDVITEAGALVMEVADGTPADGAVLRGDVITEAGGVEITSSTGLVEVIRAMEPGDVLEFTVLEADGASRSVDVVLGERDGGAFLGVSIGTYVDMIDLPFEIDIDVGRIGGPSAGLALTLSVLDLLTEGQLTGGLDVVATGTIDALGFVGPIGGIEQKSHSVLRDGADLFLVPSNDVDAARAIVGDRIPVVGVASLDQALDALVARGGDAGGILRTES